MVLVKHNPITGCVAHALRLGRPVHPADHDLAKPSHPPLAIRKPTLAGRLLSRFQRVHPPSGAKNQFAVQGLPTMTIPRLMVHLELFEGRRFAAGDCERHGEPTLAPKTPHGVRRRNDRPSHQNPSETTSLLSPCNSQAQITAADIRLFVRDAGNLVRVVPPASPEGAIAPPVEKALHLHRCLETRNPTKLRRRVHSSRIMRGAPAILMRDESHAFDPHRGRTNRLNKFLSCMPMPHPRLLYGTRCGCSSAIRNPMFDQLDFRPHCTGVTSLFTVIASAGMRPSPQALPRRRPLIEDPLRA